MPPHKDKLSGGRADEKKPSDFNVKALAEGAAHEMEHTDDKTLAQEIAMDHLEEDPDYYKKLRSIEKSRRGQAGRLTKSGDKFDLNKVVGSIRFPKMGITGKHEEAYATPGLGQRAQLADPYLRRYTPKEVEGAIAGAVIGRVNAAGSITPSKRTLSALVRSGSPLSIYEHEKQHIGFHRIGQEHGQYLRTRTANKLVGALPEGHQQTVKEIGASMGIDDFHPDASEERIAYLHSYLNDPKFRNMISHHRKWGEFVQRIHHDRAKQAMKMMRAHAKNLTAEEVMKSGEEGFDLEKVVGTIDFPKLGIKQKHNQPEYVPDSEAMSRKLSIFGVNIPAQKTPYGIVANNTYSKKPVPGHQRRIGGVVNASKDTGIAAREHEKQHLNFAAYGQKYGSSARRVLASVLVSSLPRKYHKTLNSIAEAHGVSRKNDLRDEEKVAHLQSFLNDTETRNRVAGHHGWTPEEARSHQDNAKKSMRHMRSLASGLTHEDLLYRVGALKKNDPVHQVIDIGGIQINIEWPKGSVRKYTDGYERKMSCDYGYIEGAPSSDGEELDCYVGPHYSSLRAFIVRQNRPETGKFDEEKVMLGFVCANEARIAYQTQMTPEHFGGIREVSLDEIKRRTDKTPRQVDTSRPTGIEHIVPANVSPLAKTDLSGIVSSVMGSRKRAAPAPGNDNKSAPKLDQTKVPGVKQEGGADVTRPGPAVVTANGSAPAKNDVISSSSGVRAPATSVSVTSSHPHAYEWHEGHTNHHQQDIAASEHDHISNALEKHDLMGAQKAPIHGFVDPSGKYNEMGRHEGHIDAILDHANFRSPKPTGDPLKDYHNKRNVYVNVLKSGYIALGHAGAQSLSLHHEIHNNPNHPAMKTARRLVGNRWDGNIEVGLESENDDESDVYQAPSKTWAKTGKRPTSKLAIFRTSNEKHSLMKALDIPVNPQHQKAGTSSVYAGIASHFGGVNPAAKTDLFHFRGLEKYEPEIDGLIHRHGYQVYYAGGRHPKPNLAERNYNTKHLMIYDPLPGHGGDFGHESYTRSWRKIHELAHALTYPLVNRMYGEGKRMGALGHHRTIREAKRAVHWEDLAMQKQRDLLSGIGLKTTDQDFNRERNTVLHDAVHRAVTGKFTDPAKEGFVPHDRPIPLEHALNLVDAHGKAIGLQHPDHVLSNYK